jgi:cell division protein FtsW (lipid II flippase)
MISDGQHRRSLGSSVLYLLASVPALALGVLVMRASHVPAGAWGQNIAAWAAGALFCLGMWRARSSVAPSIWADLTALLTLAALVATLLTGGTDGVHRWVRFGPVRLHIAALLLPALLIALERVARVRGWWVALLVAVGAAFILLLQPDAAQATAFAAASGILLLAAGRRSVPRLIAVLSLLVIAGLCWLRRDPLAPVPHVEGIVGLAANLGTGWAVAAIVSLLLLPLPFLLAGRAGAKRAGLALGVYVTITILAAFVGSFPVPVMGYGVSPIIGYLVGLAFLPRIASVGRERNTTDTPGPARPTE